MMLLKIRKSNVIKLLLLCIGFGLIPLTGCQEKEDQVQIQTGTNEIASSVQNFPTGTTWTGKELFFGIFFAHGRFAERLDRYDEQTTAYQSMTAEQRQKLNSDFDKLKTEIERAEPSFFNEFQSDILSKDEQRITNALGKGAGVLAQHLGVIYPEFNAFKNQLDQDIEKGRFNNADGEFDLDKLQAAEAEYQDILNNNAISTDSKLCSLAAACYFALVIHNVVAVTFAGYLAVMIRRTVAFWTDIRVRHANGLEDMAQLEYEMLVADIKAAAI